MFRRYLAAALAVIVSIGTRSTPHVRDLVVDALNQRFRSQVELGSLAVDAFPRPAITGSGLRLRHNGRTDVEPLIAIESFSASAGLWALATAPPLPSDNRSSSTAWTSAFPRADCRV